MRNTLVTLLLGISTVALLILCLIQHRQIQNLRASSPAAVPAVAPKATAAHAIAKPAVAEREAGQKPPVAAAQKKQTETVAAITAPLAAVERTAKANKTAPAATNGSPMAGLAKMMKNPAMMNMVREQQKGQMDLTYGSLFKYLQLPDADLESLKGVLLDRQMALVSLSLDMMDTAATAEERKAATDAIKQTTAEYETRIKELLGDDNYAVYQSFESTQPERMQVNLFKGALNQADQMTEEQEDTLIRAMHAERTNFQFSVTGSSDMQITDPSQLTQESIAKLVEETARLQSQYTARAATILTPAQLEQFMASQRQQQAMQEMGMKMAAQMFGQSGASTNSP